MNLELGKLSIEENFEKYNLEYPSGYIIAKVNLTDCIEINKHTRIILKEKNPLVYSNIIKHPEWKGYGFKLENIEKIEPIKIDGKLSFWNYDL